MTYQLQELIQVRWTDHLWPAQTNLDPPKISEFGPHHFHFAADMRASRTLDLLNFPSFIFRIAPAKLLVQSSPSHHQWIGLRGPDFRLLSEQRQKRGSASEEATRRTDKKKNSHHQTDADADRRRGSKGSDGILAGITSAASSGARSIDRRRRDCTSLSPHSCRQFPSCS